LESFTKIENLQSTLQVFSWVYTTYIYRYLYKHQPNMPKEQVRKRGKRKTKAVEEEYSTSNAVPEVQIDVNPHPVRQSHVEAPQPVAGPSAIHPARAAFLAGKTYIPPPSTPGDGADFVPIPQVGIEGSGDNENGEAQWNRGPRADQEFPFGIVDPDLKAYFRGVEEQIRDWEGTNSVGEEREGKSLLYTQVR
jgi:nucleolar protein 9